MSLRRWRQYNTTAELRCFNDTPQLFSQGNTPVWCKRHRVTTGGGGEALVYRWMLPGTGRRDDNSGCGGRNGGAAKGGRADCCRGPERRLGEDRRTGPGQRYYDGGCNSEVGGSSDNFLPQWRPWCRGRRTWAMVQLGREVRSRTDYILGYDRQIIQNVDVRDPQHNSNHFMVMGCLCGASPREHLRYLGQWIRLPLKLPGRHTSMLVYKIFVEFRSAMPKPDKQVARHNSCILEET